MKETTAVKATLFGIFVVLLGAWLYIEPLIHALLVTGVPHEMRTLPWYVPGTLIAFGAAFIMPDRLPAAGKAVAGTVYALFTASRGEKS